MVYVDPDLCTGCEACVNVCPDGFVMENGIAIVKDPGTSCIREAQKICPVSAIKNAGPGTETSTASQDFVSPPGKNVASKRRYGGGFRGRGPGKNGGPGGYCVCPDCGHKEQRRAGRPCYRQRCPKCNAFMTR
ncbi:MAG: ferredoxin [Candidatus Marinimicrobia bacterium]|nr:ferredoxin [Candidatus Neomarinimicrobiota bacterium]